MKQQQQKQKNRTFENRAEDSTLNENDKKVILRKKELFKTSPIRSRKTKNIFFLHKFNF
jgi:hypothetical protein